MFQRPADQRAAIREDDREWRAPSGGVGYRTCVAFLICGASLACGSEPSTPNVLLIVLDTVRADAMGVELNQRAITPHLNELVASGMLFENSYSTAPWTLPSHSTLFTGLLPSQHGAVHEHFRLEQQHATLAELLAAKGFATHGISSNPWVARSRGISQGFEQFEEIFLELEDQDDKGAALATERAIHWIESRKEQERPFFLFVNYLEAHLPYSPPDAGFEVVGLDPESLARRTFSIHEAEAIITGQRLAAKEEIESARILYWIEIAYQDQALGRLLDHLRSEALLDQTLVVITADHGELFAEQGLMGHEFSLADSLLRVPLVIRYPPLVEAGLRISEPVSHLDVLPTILGLLETSPSTEALQGVNLLDPRAIPRSRSTVAEYSAPKTLLHSYWATRHPDFDTRDFDVSLRSVRKADHKLIADSRGNATLFDLAADPGEREDVCAAAPEICAALREELASSGWPIILEQ